MGSTSGFFDETHGIGGSDFQPADIAFAVVATIAVEGFADTLDLTMFIHGNVQC